MDYTNIPRSLIYKDRASLNEFGVQNNGTINNYLFTQMRKLTLLHCGNAKEIALQCLNNAYYICTLTQLDDFPDLCMDIYEKKLLEVKIPFSGDVYQASMALVCVLLAAYDDKYKQKDNLLIKSIHDWTSSNKWTGSQSHKSFVDIIKTCNTDSYIIHKNEFAPRDIIDAIENVSVNDLAIGVRYVCEKLTLLDDQRRGMYGVDLAIARLRDDLREIYEDWEYDPKTKKFDPEMEDPIVYDLQSFSKDTELKEKAVEYITNHYPSQNDDSDKQSISTKEKQTPHKGVPNLVASQTADAASLLKRIADLEKLNTELEKNNKNLREQLANSPLVNSKEFEELKSRTEMLQSLYDAAENRLKRYETILGTEEELSKEKQFSIAERIIFCSALLGCSLSEDDIIQQQMAKMIKRFSGDKWESIRTTISKMNGKRNALVEVANKAKKEKDAGARMAVWRKEEEKYKGITRAAQNVYYYLHSAVKGGTVQAKIHYCKQAMENIDQAYYLSERKLITYNQPEVDEDMFTLPSADI